MIFETILVINKPDLVKKLQIREMNEEGNHYILYALFR